MQSFLLQHLISDAGAQMLSQFPPSLLSVEDERGKKGGVGIQSFFRIKCDAATCYLLATSPCGHHVETERILYNQKLIISQYMDYQ